MSNKKIKRPPMTDEEIAKVIEVLEQAFVKTGNKKLETAIVFYPDADKESKIFVDNRDKKKLH